MEQNDIFNNAKQMILSRQTYKCANAPSYQIPGLNHYNCLLWKHRNGLFDESGGQFDYLQPPSNQGQVIDVNNIIALCPSCSLTRNRNHQQNVQVFNNVNQNVSQQTSSFFNKMTHSKNFNNRIQKMDCN